MTTNHMEWKNLSSGKRGALEIDQLLICGSNMEKKLIFMDNFVSLAWFACGMRKINFRYLVRRCDTVDKWMAFKMLLFLNHSCLIL